jgi:hypothetical protein
VVRKSFANTPLLVNELSNTIDLDSTLIRAEALFRRFQRLVEAIDKKQNFPKPRVVRNDSSSSAPALPEAEARDTGKAKEDQDKKVISPELRKLLSRNVDILPRNVVQKKGDGFTAADKK